MIALRRSPIAKCTHSLTLAYIQGCAKEWALGCLNPASWLPPTAGGEFTQPRAHSFAHLCVFSYLDFAISERNFMPFHLNTGGCERTIFYGGLGVTPQIHVTYLIVTRFTKTHLIGATAI